ncbi:hypothetical protein K437DRAFT_267283 [Tilletiaria anomala UBC 951]|uniref:UBC core domain-containing protein n=1 Tax=Tilletiaria anomala (strain ATCC 24038 / CBS 436.72 / UBC 951) TaxID=1037660 RepID=A0A066WCZ2_TILAU|nr:uncharacterized protein K437DRAFT_267283 [Tilletiaria anomala UBC 951]KDN50378.1 hypothetical protein K437DRAFT_267283 [Tilletiaria anomala UBC 951]
MELNTWPFIRAQLREPKNITPGVYIIPDEANLLTWHGVIFVRRGPYAGGIFRFDIHFLPSFLSGTAVPDVIFPPTLLHPLVDATTFRLSLLPRFSSASNATAEAWNACRNSSVNLLRYIRDAFTVKVLNEVSERQAANKDVYAMYRTNHELFLKLASQSKHLSTSSDALYDSNSGSGLPGPGRQGAAARSEPDAAVTAEGVRAGGSNDPDDGRGPGISFKALGEEEYERIKTAVLGVS